MGILTSMGTFTSLYIVLCCCIVAYGQDFLSVEGTQFKLNGKTVFLSGVNQPWINYGNDFGGSIPATGDGWGKYCQLRNYISGISKSGGNSIRIWLFVEGDNIPTWDNAGNVNGTDISGSLISDMIRYVRVAQEFNVLVFFCLWNGTVLRNKDTINMIKDAVKTNTFINKVLLPMVKGLMNEKGVGGYEIMNEPEGSVIPGEKNSNPCFDTTVLDGTGAGWAGHNFHMYELLRFHNQISSAIHGVCKHCLVTVGSWSEKASTDTFGYRNYYTDKCLTDGYHLSDGILDFQQVHSYAGTSGYNAHSPFKQSFNDYGIHKPLLIGEYDTHESGMTSAEQYSYVYSHQYNGAWGWDAIGGGNADSLSILSVGLNTIKSNPGVQINLSGSNQPNCQCSDKSPPGQYNCTQQSEWGKCTDSWMKGYCCKSCHGCVGCT